RVKEIVGGEIPREQTLGGDRRRSVDGALSQPLRPRQEGGAQHVEHADAEREHGDERARIARRPHRPETRYHRRRSHLLRIDDEPQQSEHREGAGRFDDRGETGHRDEREPAPALARRQPADHRLHITNHAFRFCLSSGPHSARLFSSLPMQDLTTGLLTSHLLKTTSFMLVSMIFQTLYILVDLFWVGRLGTDAIAAVGLAGNLSFVVIAITQVLGVGATTVVSHAAGRKDQDRAIFLFNQSQVLSMVVAVVFLAISMALRHQYASEQSASEGMRIATEQYLQ